MGRGGTCFVICMSAQRIETQTTNILLSALSICRLQLLLLPGVSLRQVTTSRRFVFHAVCSNCTRARARRNNNNFVVFEICFLVFYKTFSDNIQSVFPLSVFLFLVCYVQQFFDYISLDFYFNVFCFWFYGKYIFYPERFEYCAVFCVYLDLLTNYKINLFCFNFILVSDRQLPAFSSAYHIILFVCLAPQ